MRISKNRLSNLISDQVRQTVKSEMKDYQTPQDSKWGRLLMGGQPSTEITEMENGRPRNGKGFAGMTRCLILAKGSPETALRIAVNQYGKGSQVTQAIAKSLAAGDFTAGGFMVPDAFSAEVIDLLRPRSVVRAMDPQVEPIPRGHKFLPLLQTGASASWVGENQDIPVTQPVGGDKSLVARKLAAIITMSNELRNFSAGQAEQTILSDITQKMAEQEDIAFLRGVGSESEPLGIRNRVVAANSIATNGTSSTNIEDDFKDLVNALDILNVPDLRRWWVMHPSRRNHLLTLRDANGNLMFPEIRTATPTIHTYPVAVTTSIPADGGAGSDESELYLVEASEIILGEMAGGMEVKFSEDASYLDENSNNVSAFTRDQQALRVTNHLDVQLRHDEAVAVKTAVTWGS